MEIMSCGSPELSCILSRLLLLISADGRGGGGESPDSQKVNTQFIGELLHRDHCDIVLLSVGTPCN